MSADRTPGKQSPVLEEYSRLAADYDTRWSFYVEATTRETVTRLRLGADARVLDVGCGTGALLHRLGHAYPRAQLFGLDPVPEMLAVARRRLPPLVALREGWAERLPYDDERFDAVVSCSMFHYIRDPLAALREIRRVLRPGGQFVLTDWCHDYLACRACGWYLHVFSPAHFKTYGAHECRRLLEDAGYACVDIERYRINWLWGLMTASVVKQAA